ncbi:hypothetical protein W97_00020 [Coniosporium apollinis CBS 100218]|uniref:NEDD8-activating enzyme E1 regulatory subunit n=1 Tax=Coniosporium apollinis (strain CBS 100218) TaxID=1168221 RepID=R7YGM9_CONA1|nr:uncharacterized protein W97_00020 [Coniosporium apollinis CBS 100218]EON60811.1 hypothetical protein W97_00020 [Coniosporium apollinis CBS 100218]
MEEPLTETTPPILQDDEKKRKKYDRQLRLWAASGQQALEEAHVLLINSGPGVVGVETLKNLVLPGIGQFTILDSAEVTEADLGVNFFLEPDDVGKFRAERTCALLEELNPDVQGHYNTEPVEYFLTQSSDTHSLRPFTHILVTAPIVPELLADILTHCRATSKPLFYIHCVGFYSVFSVQLPSAFPIVDTHPDPTATTDLRLLTPWPALSALVEEKTRDLDSMNAHEHGHVPYVLIILHFLEVWKQTHDGQVPSNYREKSDFKELVRKGMRINNPEGGEENFEEAIAAVLKSLNPSTPSSAVKEVFDAEECKNLTHDSPHFWVIAHAVSDFYKAHNALPLPGSIPDMKAQSADYIQLQNVYKTKAREDVAEVTLTVRELAKQHGHLAQVDEKEIEAFCKNAAHIKLVRGRPINPAFPGQKLKWGQRAKAAVSALTNPDSLILIHIAFLAFDEFCASHDADALASAPRAPGSQDSEVEFDAEKMTGIANTIIDNLINEAGTRIEEPDYSDIGARVANYVQDIVRAGGGELHNIAALTGGMVAQEVIKVVTKQYVPVDNTCVFDGVGSRTEVLRLGADVSV